MNERIDANILINEWKQDPDFIAEYNAQAPQFSLYEEMIKLRKDSKMSLQQIADKMGTSESSLSRLLSGKQAPSWNTIMRFADAMGKKPILQFIDN